MKLLKKISKLFLPLIATGGLASSSIASEGSLGKPVQMFRFKTPEMVKYVNSTVSLLDKEENPNKRHLKTLRTCQKLFSSGKNAVRGMEIKTLKVCRSYMNTGLYQTSTVSVLENELEKLKQVIRGNKENQNSKIVNNQNSNKRENNQNLNKRENNQTEIQIENNQTEIKIEIVNNPSEAQKRLDQIQASLNMYEAISKVVKRQRPDVRSRFNIAIKREIKKLNAEKQSFQQEFFKQYSTPITPTNQNLNISSFKASETFPKVPFYVPGTNEFGEMLTIPRVTDEGDLVYRLDFLDPTLTYERVRDSIIIPHENINGVIKALLNIDKWTITAQENNVTRRISKTALCIPKGRCENKKKGVMSTEIVFQVYEDGSTAGRIQRNKGTYSVGYNLSVESSVLLSAYLTYMRDTGFKEFNMRNMSDAEIESLFN